MSNQRFTALIQALVLTIGAVGAIAQPVQSYAAGRQAPDRMQQKLQISFLNFIFPNRRERTRGSRKGSRAPFDTSKPNMLSPRNTTLLAADELILQWYPVEGAVSYTVEVTGPNVDWAVEVTGTEVPFDELASLVPNNRYTLVVTTDTGKTTEFEESVGFIMLSEQESDRVKAQIDAIKAEPLDPDEEALAISLAYRDFEHSDPVWRSESTLRQAAINVLETRIEAGTEDCRVYLLQADTYLETGLYLLAQERYEQALAYATAAEQPELQAESYWGLGEVAARQTEYEDALEYLQMAKELYEAWITEEIRTQIEEVEEQLSQ